MFEDKKNGKEICFVLGFYGRFLSNTNTTRARTMMISTNNPAMAGTKYVSATEVAAVAVGADVAAKALA